jgi:hypothetical protein
LATDIALLPFSVTYVAMLLNLQNFYKCHTCVTPYISDKAKRDSNNLGRRRCREDVRSICSPPFFDSTKLAEIESFGGAVSDKKIKACGFDFRGLFILHCMHDTGTMYTSAPREQNVLNELILRLCFTDRLEGLHPPPPSSRVCKARHPAN